MMGGRRAGTRRAPTSGPLVRAARGRPALGALLLTTLTLAACDDPTGPDFQVIEETEFAASLGIDLASMTRLGTGVYVLDITVGGGEQVSIGSTPTVTYTGWLADGSEFDTGTFSFLMGNNRVVSGLEDGMIGMSAMRVGGTRLMIIPPNRGYGGQEQSRGGVVVIPSGSILVFEVTVDAVAVP